MADNLGAAATSLAGDNSPASTPAATPSTPTPAANAEWYAALPPETLGLLEKKGWNNPNGLPNLIKSYSELEKQFSSSDKVILPKDEADTEGWGKFWAKLGRPENADAYRFPDGVDAAAVKALAPKLHELGITQKQAAALATLDLQRHATAQESERQRVVADQNAADADLRGEWGAKYNENVEFARRAMRGLGMNLDDFVMLGGAIGSKRALQLLHLAGINTREDNAAAIGDAAAGFGMTPNRAAAELAEKGRDLLERARNGDKGAMAQWVRLQKAKGGDGMMEI